jgi:two-component system LytT family sensor kinase
MQTRGRLRMTAWVLLVWLLVAVLRTVLWWGQGAGVRRLLVAGVLYSLASLFWVAVTLAASALARRTRSWSLPRLLTLHALLGGAVAALEAAVWQGAVSLVATRAAPGDLLFTVINRLDTNLVFYAAVAALAHVLDRGRAVRAQARSRARLAAEYQRARFEALTVQLQPHFLFNTLHAVAELVHRDPHAAAALARGLARLLEASLAAAPREGVVLQRELDFVKAYLDIQRARFPGLAVEWAIEPGTQAALVPHFLLQPLVENALRHGATPAADAARVAISARRRGGNLRLEVRDHGPGPRSGASLHRGLGLWNTRKRLRHLYGARGRLRLASPPGGGTAAVVDLPWRAAEPGSDADA